jgi:CRP-like cAMP-binding protein
MAEPPQKDTSGRLASLLLYLVESEGYEMPARYTHEQLGAMIGLKRVAMSRAFRKLRDAGAVEYVGREVPIRDLQALERAWDPGACAE